MRALLAACAVALAAACMPHELVLRRASLDWDSLGITQIAVLPEATGDLAPLSVDAAELLAFALKQSAVSVATAPELPRLDVTVKEVAISEEGASDPAQPRRITSLRQEMGYGRPPSRIVRATVLVKLMHPGSTRPLWFKEAIGTVDLGAARGAQNAGDEPFPPAQRLDRQDDAEALAFYRDIAVRRALKQIADDLLPHYEYRELR
ncbi:MAG: hypothetical protein FJZ01_21620 [Candidatus Sericytochromatia bacterium]|nr:hypothetical protein [Candidatus Tanganyikabacteria bacterium]